MPALFVVATRRYCLLVCLALLVQPHVLAAAEFRLALPGYRYQFPRDHASHPAFQTEWWYYTGHLQSARTFGRSPQRFGYQLTFFRTALVPQLRQRRSKWAVRDVIFAHLALTDETGRRFYFTDRINRAALGLAGADSSRKTKSPRIWLGEWTLRFTGQRGEVQTMRAGGKSAAPGTKDATFAIVLTQRLLKPPVIHGQNGISQKSEGRGRASHYYSLTRLATSGQVRIGNREYTVSGQSWFDHEFGSNQLTPNQTGWDWFSLQFEDGRELMLYHIRLRGGGTDPYSSGTLVERNGRTRHLLRGDFRIEPLATWRSPVSGAVYPARWRVTLPREKISLEITPTIPNQELDTKNSTQIVYWEGSIRVTGTRQGQPLRGVGYVELTGYAKAFNGLF